MSTWEGPTTAQADQPSGQEIPLFASVLAALAYADLFDYPLNVDELVKYQVGTAFSRSEIADGFGTEVALRREATALHGYYCLRGRENTISTRQQRGAVSARMWRRARFYAIIIRHLPFVRMLAVTGALAVDNISGRTDIDLLVVAKAGRVWICRRALIVLVRMSRLLGVELCPNYILAETSLDLRQRDLFTAHELAQMIPMFGAPHYGHMLDVNRWAAQFLPLGFEPRGEEIRPRVLNVARRALERVLGSRLFDAWERWELERMRAKLRPLLGGTAEVVCSMEQCKGHVGLHRETVMRRYAVRLQELGLYDYFGTLLQAQ